MSTAILAEPSCPTTPVEQITDSVISPLDRLAERWGRLSARATAATLGRADLLHRHLSRHLAGLTGGARRETRARLVSEVTDRLATDGHDCNATRLLGIRAVAEAFGRNEAVERSASALAELIPLLRRTRDSEEWEVRAAYRTEVDRLWRRIVRDHLGAPAIRAAVAAIRGRPASPAAPRTRRPSAAAFAAKATEADLAELVEVLPDDLLDYLSSLLSRDNVLPEIDPKPSVSGLFRRLSG